MDIGRTAGRHAACFCEHGRRNLLALGNSRHSRRRSVEVQHHLQAALQRCRRDDRRPTGGIADDADGHGAPAVVRGVKPVRLVSDHPEQYAKARLPSTVSVHHRDELERIQRELREVPGVSAIVYEQTCAAEKRRRRKRGLLADPQERLFINPDVCEGCGDCSVQSNCISVQPLETEFGRKRKIDQSTCNKDYSCLKGFCPSFVTVSGARIAKRARRYGGPRSNDRGTAGAANRPPDRQGLQHPGRRNRRNRRADHRRSGRHGGSSGWQRMHHPRHDRHGAERRLRHQPHPHRRRSEDDLQFAPERGDDGSAHRMRHDRGLRRRGIENDEPGSHRCDPQHRCLADRRIPVPQRHGSRRWTDAHGDRGCARRRSTICSACRQTRRRRRRATASQPTC